MLKWLKWIVITIALSVFFFSLLMIGSILYQYRKSDELYADATKQFVRPADSTPQVITPEDGEPYVAEVAPIAVDFDALHAVNTDVIGWLYCEDTVIDYPVLQGENDDQYLRHLYDGSYNTNGSIFVEALNRRDFRDANTIIYGHHMRSGAMFGGLDKWEDQAYYEAHPVMWLLTPTQDYRIDIMGGYTTSAYSDTYTVYTEPGPALNGYLAGKLAQSVIDCAAQPEDGARYVVLSTCAYVFDNARFVLHCKLVPIDSAAGVLKQAG